jgi:hypothetical protein
MQKIECVSKHNTHTHTEEDCCNAPFVFRSVHVPNRVLDHIAPGIWERMCVSLPGPVEQDIDQPRCRANLQVGTPRVRCWLIATYRWLSRHVRRRWVDDDDDAATAVGHESVRRTCGRRARPTPHVLLVLVAWWMLDHPDSSSRLASPRQQKKRLSEIRTGCRRPRFVARRGMCVPGSAERTCSHRSSSS